VNAARLDVRSLSVSFAVRGRSLRALAQISFRLEPGESLGVVGESGSGKSTLARAVLRLLPIAGGEIRWREMDLHAHGTRAMRALRRELQVVFQDPLASLDPRMTVGAIVGEPLAVFQPELKRAARNAEVARVLTRVGLSPDMINRYAHELSGGQCQRVAIARAVIVRPRLLVCDEPLSALDVSIQAQIVNLLTDLRSEFGMSLLFISHNLAAVRRMSDRVLVLYLGHTMELADRDALFAAPLHPYTRALLASIPSLDPSRARTARPVPVGEPASPLDPPSGCVFHPRCPWTVERCRREAPTLEVISGDQQVACHRWRELPAGGDTPGQ
jgi:oligopeptide transport system ATP-binding protein